MYEDYLLVSYIIKLLFSQSHPHHETLNSAYQCPHELPILNYRYFWRLGLVN